MDYMEVMNFMKMMIAAVKNALVMIKKKIQKTSDSFTEIAESLGFSSVNYFSRVFKSKTGVTPTEYSRHASKRRVGLDV